MGVAVQRALERGREAWPMVKLDAQVFRKHVARVVEAASWDWEVHAADLYLACACATGDPAAQRCLAREFFPELEAVIARVLPERAKAALAITSLRKGLWSQHGELARYAGRGSLLACLSVFATRVAFEVARHSSRPPQPLRAPS